MKSFTSKSHIPSSTLIHYLSAITLFIVLGFGIRFKEYIYHSFCIIVFVLILTHFLIKWDRSTGLYIDNDTVYYKFFKKNIINIADVVAIKITPAISAGGNKQRLYPLKDGDGNPLYSMMFLKEVTDGMKSANSGDLFFQYNYEDSVIFYVTYDQSVIDYLLTLNPNIIVF